MPWSYSSLIQYEKCPYYFKLKQQGAQPLPPGETLARGSQMHKEVEDWLRDPSSAEAPPESLVPFIAKIDHELPTNCLIEERFALSDQWQPSDWKTAWLRFIPDVMFTDDDGAVHVWDWKGLALDTDIPTVNGWTTMADIKVGDRIFSRSGRPCTVVGKSEIHHRPCYRMTFDDTSVVVCDDEHLWVLLSGEVVATKDIAARMKEGKITRMPIAHRLVLDDVDLPVDPYVLGVWLGDGKHTSGEISNPEPEVWSEIRSRGYAIGSDIGGTTCPTRTVYGLRTKLRKLGLLRNKHIPEVYLRAGYIQRLALLRGLMDSDGNVNTRRKQAVFTTCDLNLSNQVVELIASLGQRPNQCMTMQKGFGVTVNAFPIHFKPVGGLAPFLLPRKADRITKDWGEGRSYFRKVTSIEATPTVPTQCIAVDSSDSTYLFGRKMLVTHNTGKRVGNEVKHAQQGQLYCAAAAALYPDAPAFHTTFLYLDHGISWSPKPLTPDKIPAIQQGWSRRATKFLSDEALRPKPSKSNCRFCDYREACEYAVTE